MQDCLRMSTVSLSNGIARRLQRSDRTRPEWRNAASDERPQAVWAAEGRGLGSEPRGSGAKAEWERQWNRTRAGQGCARATTSPPASAARARRRNGNAALRSALIEAAWSASHSRDSYYAALYRCFCRRFGKKSESKAIFVVAHSMLVTFTYWRPTQSQLLGQATTLTTVRSSVSTRALRLYGGASWNRTSDLSIIREVTSISLRPDGSRRVPILLLTGSVQFRRGTQRDLAGLIGTQLLGRSWDRFRLRRCPMGSTLFAGVSPG